MSENKSLIEAMRADLQAKNAEVERLASTFKTENGKFVISPEQYRDYKKAVAEAKEVKDALAAAEDAAGISEFLTAAPAPAGASDMAAPAGMALEGKSLGDLVAESEAFVRARENGYEGGILRATFEGKSIYNFAAGNLPTMQALGTIQQLPMAEAARRKMHIRDLFPKSTTKASVLYALRETGWTNNAAQVRQRTNADGTASGNAKWGTAPESSLQLTPYMVPVAEIAHLIHAHKNILADDGRLRSFINTRVIDGVKYAEDRDLLHSVGDGEKITGLFNTPGIQEYTGLATDGYSIQVRRAITKVLLAELEPTGLVVSPTMFEALETELDKNGQFRVAVSVAIGAEKRVWRLPVVETTAIADEDFLVGSFGVGAQLHDRESVSVQVSTEHANNFAEGVVTFRGSERVALEVSRPESFVRGKWTEPTV